MTFSLPGSETEILRAPRWRFGSVMRRRVDFLRFRASCGGRSGAAYAVAILASPKVQANKFSPSHLPAPSAPLGVAARHRVIRSLHAFGREVRNQCNVKQTWCCCCITVSPATFEGSCRAGPPVGHQELAFQILLSTSQHQK